MFYPVEYLKRGGRFYLCWVADSWPLRFATITHKQLWSQDIRDICQDLQEVMVVESGQATARFSLRLSSQLLRGVVRLYQRKVTVFLGDLCMINAHVIKLINRKYSDEPPHRHQHDRIPRQPRVRILEIPENEERVEERIQNSGNAVANIEQITLKEAVITDIQLPNDNFGEENPEQAFQLLNDRTLEVMLATTDLSAAHHSGLDVQALETSDKSHDKSRLHPIEPVMERISEHELTFRKSTALGDITMPVEELDKEIPQIPEILPTDLQVPSPPKESRVEQMVEEPLQNVVEEPARKSDESLHLPELCAKDLEPAKRRRQKRLIVDKKTEISGNVIRTRLQAVDIELRCENSSEDIVDPYRLSHATYFRRPAHTGWRLHSRLATPLDFMFLRNLGHRPCNTSDKEQEVVSADDIRYRKNRTTLEKITEENYTEVPIPAPPILEVIQPDLEMIIDAPVIPEELTLNHAVTNVENIDIADMPTQVLATASQGHAAKKRQATQCEVLSPAKRSRACGFVSFKLSQQSYLQETLNVRENIIQPEQELLPAEESKLQDDTANQPKDPNDQCQVTQMLELAGLADARNMPVIPRIVIGARKSRKDISDDSSETQLGSLDRTQVDLGESEKTTDSQRFMRHWTSSAGHVSLPKCNLLYATCIQQPLATFISKEWGTQGTMFKIIHLVHRGVSPLTVKELIELGPKNNGPKTMVAARCFTALLKLKQHNFINLEKDMETLEITNILIGPRFQRN